MEIEQSHINNLEKIVKTNYQIFKGMYKDKPYSFAQYKTKLEGKKSIIFIAKEAGNIIGDTVSFQRDGSFYIWIMGVAKEKRNQGIGNKLLKINKKYAKENGFNSISIKVYDVSKEMKKLLIKNDYKLIKIEHSKKEIYTANHHLLTLK